MRKHGCALLILLTTAALAALRSNPPRRRRGSTTSCRCPNRSASRASSPWPRRVAIVPSQMPVTRTERREATRRGPRPDRRGHYSKPRFDITLGVCDTQGRLNGKLIPKPRPGAEAQLRSSVLHRALRQESLVSPPHAPWRHVRGADAGTVAPDKADPAVGDGATGPRRGLARPRRARVWGAMRSPISNGWPGRSST